MTFRITRLRQLSSFAIGKWAYKDDGGIKNKAGGGNMDLTIEQRRIANAKIMIAKELATNSGTFIEIQIDRMIKEIISKVKISASDASKEQYRKLYKSCTSKSCGDLKNCLMSCKTRASFDKTRTSFRFCIAEEIQRLRRESEKAMKAKDYDLGKKKIQEAFKLAVKFEDEFLSENRIIFNDVKNQKGFKRVSFSKKKGLKKAPSADEIIKSFSVNDNISDRYALAFSVIATFGIRPAELQKGVKLQFHDGMIYAVVQGAKVGSDKGQKVRAMGSALRENNESDKVIMDAIYKAGGEVVVTQNKKDYESLRKYLNRHHPGTSLYTYRHKVASDLKASGLQKRQIAEFLGHRTTDSQQYYGYSRSSSGGRSMTAKGSNEVRVKPDIKDYLKPAAKPAAVPLGSKIKQAKTSISTASKAPKFKPPGIK